jgi:hypothetical protein
MKFHAIDMPDEPAQLAAWLERRLTGPDLAALADELTAFRQASNGSAPAVRELLGEWQEPVLAGGLKLAPPDVVRRLLSWPERLLDLQELVFMQGGRYWDRLLDSDTDIPNCVQRSKQQLSAALPLAGQTGQPIAGRIAAPLQKPSRRRFAWVAGVAAAAAAVVAAVGISRTFPPVSTPTTTLASSPEVAWGWNRPGALDQSGSAPQYLNRIADGAQEWFDKRPDDPEGVKQRLKDLYQGCGLVVLAEHRPLSDEDRGWLTDKCRQWAAKMKQEGARRRR